MNQATTLDDEKEKIMENMEAVKSPKRKKTEVLVILLVVIVAALIVGVKMNLNSKAAKENALMSELRAVRTSVQLFMTLNKMIPADLKSLVTQKYTIGEKQGPYLSGINVDKNGDLLDAFGNKFGYDPKTGRVWSVTKNYENW
jgi:type II secretory pathway pseudopilin PulG